ATALNLVQFIKVLVGITFSFIPFIQFDCKLNLNLYRKSKTACITNSRTKNQ
ncbi:MAG: hypothetical protein ACI90V_003211, partial [Bacillariaceae sp.]